MRRGSSSRTNLRRPIRAGKRPPKSYAGAEAIISQAMALEWLGRMHGRMAGALTMRGAMEVYFNETIAPQLRRGGHSIKFETCFDGWWNSLTKTIEKTGEMGTTTKVLLVEGREWRLKFGNITLEKS